MLKNLGLQSTQDANIYQNQMGRIIIEVPRIVFKKMIVGFFPNVFKLAIARNVPSQMLEKFIAQFHFYHFNLSNQQPPVFFDREQPFLPLENIMQQNLWVEVRNKTSN
jgi:hypothetical protein